MANAFKNAGAALAGTGRTTIYTAPGATASILHAIYLSNVDGSNSVNATVEATIDGGSTYIKIANLLPVPDQSTLVLDKPVNLETGDILAVTASVGGDLEVFCSVLEVT